MGDVSNNGALCISHPEQVAGVYHQVRVAKHGATLAQHDVWIAYRATSSLYT